LLTGHQWSYGFSARHGEVARWCGRCLNGATADIFAALRLDTPPAPTPDTTFELLRDVVTSRPICAGDPRADIDTLVKIIVFLVAVHKPADPAGVLNVARERITAAEDYAAIRHLDPDRSRE
jgi:hypothetical protein